MAVCASAGTVSFYVHLVRTGSAQTAVPVRLISHTLLPATEIYTVWKTLFLLRKEHVAGSRLAVQSAGVHWAPLLKCIHVSSRSKLSREGLQPWWESRRRDISTVRALSWAVLLLGRKFLQPLMTFSAFMMWWRCIASSSWCERVGVKMLSQQDSVSEV